jgi:hypothetical protein
LLSKWLTSIVRVFGKLVQHKFNEGLSPQGMFVADPMSTMFVDIWTSFVQGIFSYKPQQAGLCAVLSVAGIGLFGRL